MNKNFNNLLMIILSGILLANVGCGKYEDGPGFSLKSKKARVDGKWKVTEYKLNDSDLLSTEGYFEGGYIGCLDGTIIPCGTRYYYQYYYWTFDRNGSWNSSYLQTYSVCDEYESEDSCAEVNVQYDYSITTEGSWEFGVGKKSLLLKMANLLQVPGMTAHTGYKWDILELRNDRIKLEQVYYDKTYTMVLEPK